MPAFAANLTMMFTEWPFLDRFAAAADAGFAAVEYLFPYAFPAEAIAERLREHGLKQAMFNLPPGDWDAGERGIAVIGNRFDEFKTGVERALDYAEATGAKRLHVMAGMASALDDHAIASYTRAVTYAAESLAEKGLVLLLEPINARSMPGYFLSDFEQAERIVSAPGPGNVRLQYDLFHRQISNGDVTVSLRRLMPMIGHIQIASVPSRNEPDGEELNFPFLLGELDGLGYTGFVGCEYVPRAGTVEGLGWFEPYRTR